MAKKKTELVDSGVKLGDFLRPMRPDWRIERRFENDVIPPSSLNVVGVAVCNDGVWWVVER